MARWGSKQESQDSLEDDTEDHDWMTLLSKNKSSTAGNSRSGKALSISFFCTKRLSQSATAYKKHRHTSRVLLLKAPYKNLLQLQTPLLKGNADD